MVRPIKFRFLDKKNQKMLVQNPLSSNLKAMTWTGNVYDNGVVLDVIPMQYTGIKDINGVEIYESDILQESDEYFYGAVVYADACFSFVAIDADFESYLYTVCDPVVCGNIYENPELTERKK